MKTFLTRDQFTQYYTATGGETQIPLTRTVCRTNTDFAVFRNGLFQIPGSSADYVFIDRYGNHASTTEAFVSAIAFNTNLTAGDRISIVSGVISGTNLTDIYNYIGDTGSSVTLTTPYNLNNLIHGGRYFLAYNVGNTNCPVSVDCHIQVFQKDSGNMVQTIYPVDGTSPVWRSYSNGTWNGWNTYSVVLQPSITGSCTTNGTTDNTVQLTGIVTTLGLEVGDVIRIQYGGYNKLHTVESITNNSLIVVNYEHAGNRGNGSLKLANTTASATITRIAKWYNAPVGLGQAWVSVLNLRSQGTTYTNETGRMIIATIVSGGGSLVSTYASVDGANFRNGVSGGVSSAQLGVTLVIPNESTYVGTSLYSLSSWSELR